MEAFCFGALFRPSRLARIFRPAGKIDLKKEVENHFNSGYPLYRHRCTIQMEESILNFYISMTEENMEPFTVVYMRRTGGYGEENAALMRRFKDWARENGLEDAAILAVALDDPLRTKDAKCRYDVCMRCPEDGRADLSQVRVRAFAGGKYAVFLIPHTAEAVGAAWRECFLALADGGFALDAGRPVVERYPRALVDRRLCEICVPIL